MSTAPAAPKKTNRIGLEVLPYRGGKTTLCAGCGHNSITERLIEAYYEMGVEPWRVAKMSGIGCSSKTPAYFLSQSHGFNAVHGRAPAVATGALLGNHTLECVVISGDGDTASIGIGQFMHMLRRNVPLTYIIENNGVYGLTKGQFSATADIGSKLKTGTVNELHPIDCCLMGIELGATLVARSFSGDKRQLSAILKTAIAHNGLAVIDVISPCVTFNDHVGSTKSYAYMKDHEEPLHELDFVPGFSEIEVEMEEGESRVVQLHDGSRLVLHKLEQDYDPTNRFHAVEVLHEATRRQEVLTGIIYLDNKRPNFTDTLELVDEPLATLPMERIRPTRQVLEQINEEFR
ncbi:2-oxoacid:ferredoxin oxidoreductase subunit beta [uncultured Paludibaculum sp.]|uniref:2-oxoacid:ferredoxin oxidoreductase subunit beta n=1 Tax=uncultured Paludibaculum sp. TaxID=1765020 RepID=UPI002AAB017B|nr:2-oxoacid:ferredoxin oxidoreductase subunit beta [uncultured Paludibaculum sp.]